MQSQSLSKYVIQNKLKIRQFKKINNKYVFGISMLKLFEKYKKITKELMKQKNPYYVNCIKKLDI